MIEPDATSFRRWAGKHRPTHIVLDHYGFDAAWAEEIGAAGIPLLLLDDLAGWAAYPACVRWILNVNPAATDGLYRGRASPATEVLTGGAYTLLRSEFRAPRRAGRGKTLDLPVKILISFGASAQAAWLAGEVLAAIAAAALPWALEITLIGANLGEHTGPQAVRLASPSANVAGLMDAADMGILAAGTMALEAACRGLPALVVTLEDNQEPNARWLAGSGVAVPLGRWPAGNLASTLSRLIEDLPLQARLSGAGQAAIDGQGALRVARLLQAVHTRTS
jgi:spore coat polysaccharide biosynthesis predicted glycosyltransferase SpsG